jgi:hypothetical protein
MQWTDKLIASLIACPKELKGLHPKDKSNFRHRETEGRAISINGGHQFIIWNRIHTSLPEHYTWGLRYVGKDKRQIVLVRYNGDHGEHGNPDGTKIRNPHIHLITADEVLRGLTEPEFAKSTNRYRWMHEAAEVFRLDTKVHNWGKFFKPGQEMIPGEEWGKW